MVGCSLTWISVPQLGRILVKASLRSCASLALLLHFDDTTILRPLQPQWKFCDHTPYVQRSPCYGVVDPLHAHFTCNAMLHILLVAKNSANNVTDTDTGPSNAASENGIVHARSCIEEFVDSRRRYKDR